MPVGLLHTLKCRRLLTTAQAGNIYCGNTSAKTQTPRNGMEVDTHYGHNNCAICSLDRLRNTRSQ